jgi:transposase-like protein
MSKISYAGYRFPPEIIQQAIWLYVRFTLSFRDVEDLLEERGIMVSYETGAGGTILGRRSQRTCANATQAPYDLASRRSLSENRWPHGTRRNKRAALKLMRKLLKKYGFVPEKLITDDLRSYAAAASDLGITRRHERGRWRNNRAENSHPPTRRRERKMQGFKSMGSAQRFLSTHAATYNTFNVQRHLTSARTHRAFRASAMQAWREVVAAA